MCLLSFYEAFFCQTLFQTVDFVIKFKNYQNVLKYQLLYIFLSWYDHFVDHEKIRLFCNPFKRISERLFPRNVSYLCVYLLHNACEIGSKHLAMVLLKLLFRNISNKATFIKYFEGLLKQLWLLSIFHTANK